MGENDIPLGKDSRVFTLKELTDLTGYKTIMTLRRWIMEGKLKADLVDGDHGKEYRIKEADIPQELIDRAAAKGPLSGEPDSDNMDMALQLVQRIEDNYKAQLREKETTNLQLAAELGASRERERALQAKLDEQARFLQSPAASGAGGEPRGIWERIKELFR